MTFPREPDHPEIPYPFPPMREAPRRDGPTWVPMVEMPGGAVQERLAARRTVLLTGPLEHDRATALCAELMALDGGSGDPVALVVNSRGGPVEALSPVLDIIELLRAPLHTTCIGTAAGTAGVLVAIGTGQRRIAAHATVSLRCDHPESIGGTTAEVGRRVDALRDSLRRVRDALATRTGLAASMLDDELDHGATHDATMAVELGLVDSLARPRRSS